MNPFRPMSDWPTLEELQAGMEYYISLAKKSGIKTYLGTLLPIYGWRTYAQFREDLRHGFNEYLRNNPRADGCIDFDAALRSKENPLAFKEGFDSGDHLHPSEIAYKEMAELAYKGLF